MCDHSAAQIVDSSGGIESGRFREEYLCECGAKGTIRGDASSPPSEWDRFGEVFQ